MTAVDIFLDTNILIYAHDADAADTVCRYLAWRVIENTQSLLRQALVLQQRWQLSYWDAAVVAAAQQAGAGELWTEDLTAGQDFGGLVVVNPLAGTRQGQRSDA